MWNRCMELSVLRFTNIKVKKSPNSKQVKVYFCLACPTLIFCVKRLKVSRPGRLDNLDILLWSRAVGMQNSAWDFCFHFILSSSLFSSYSLSLFCICSFFFYLKVLLAQFILKKSDTMASSLSYVLVMVFTLC
jgi:hypothetical protein